MTYYPSNFILTTVGNDIETLTNALAFAQKGGHLHADGYVILPAAEQNLEADPIVYDRVPALAFYAFGKPHRRENYVEKKMSAPTSIAHFLYSWLEEIALGDYGPAYGGDGSSRKGWRLNVGYETCGVGEYQRGTGIEMVSISSIYPDLDFYCFEFMIRPEWTFYAK